MHFESWNVSPAILVNKMSQSPAIAATMDGELVSHDGTQEGKNTFHLAAIRL